MTLLFAVRLVAALMLGVSLAGFVWLAVIVIRHRRRPSNARLRYQHVEAIYGALAAAERDGYLGALMVAELMDTIDDRMCFVPQQSHSMRKR
jgi:hypothetical protein